MSRRRRKPPARTTPSAAASKQADAPAWTHSLTQSKWKIPAALALLHLAIAIAAFPPTPFTGGDDATYISLARSLIQRHDYTDIWDPSLPPHTLYPPVF